MTYKKPVHVMVRQVGDECLLLNTESERYFSLNQVGNGFYTRIIDGVDVADAVSQIAAEYAVGEEAVSADCNRLLEELIKRDLIEQAA